MEWEMLELWTDDLFCGACIIWQHYKLAGVQRDDIVL